MAVISSPEITVIGGGLVGLTFAIAAANRGFEVALYDQKPQPEPGPKPNAQVLALNSTSTDLLNNLGIWDELGESDKTPYSRMQVFDGQSAGQIAFSAKEADLEALGHIVEQQALLVSLADAAEACDSLTLNWSTSRKDSAPVELLVAADGAHSKIRQSLGLRSIRYAYSQQATVCWARLAEAHDHTAWQWFHRTGPIALLPMHESNLVAVVWSSSEELAHLSDDDFTGRLLEATEGRLGTIEEVGARFSFPLMQLQAMQYVKEGAALLGDAAHAIHPLAGQGANLGLADVDALVTELCAGRLEGRSAGDLITLKRYERSRRSHNHLAGLAMESFHQLFTSDASWLSLLRNQGLRLVDQNNLLKKLAIDVAAGRL